MHALRSAVIPPNNARAKVESLRVRRGHSAQCPRMASWFPTSGVETPNGCALELVSERPSTHREQLGGYDEAQTRNSALVRPESASCTHPLRC